MSAGGYGAEAPRFEFRVFGEALSALRERIEALEGEAERDEGEQLYLLAPDRTGVNLKLRDGRLELKRLSCMRGPLERWTSPETVGPPLTPERLALLAEAVGAPTPDTPPDDPLALAELLGLLVVRVAKARTRRPFGGGFVEHARLALNRESVETVAVEAETATETLRLMAALSLSDRRNVSYPRFLSERAALRVAPRAAT